MTPEAWETDPPGPVSGSGRVIRGGAFQAPCPCGFLAWRIQSAATGSSIPLSVLMDSAKTINAVFVPDSRDPDGDGLTNYQENVTYHSNPNVADTDGEGFNDGYEVNSGFDPNKETSTPETGLVIYTAVEIRFGAALGQNYRV